MYSGLQNTNLGKFIKMNRLLFFQLIMYIVQSNKSVIVAIMGDLKMAPVDSEKLRFGPPEEYNFHDNRRPVT